MPAAVTVPPRTTRAIDPLFAETQSRAGLGLLIFPIEGSLLDRRLSIPVAGEILARTEAVECEHVGLADAREASQIRHWLSVNRSLLNEARAEALPQARLSNA
jgi:hypothetical protein